jgi:hypothetical protein
LYTAPVQVNQTVSIKAIGVKTGAPNSAVATGTFTITNPSVVATPVISPGTGTYSGSRLVAITTTTTGAEIYYTTTGNNPVIGTSFTRLYTGPFWVSATTTIRAMGVKAGLTNSSIATAFLTITSGTVAAPEPVSIYPAPGQFTVAQMVELEYPDPAATLYYTLDGSEPDPNSPNTFVYTGPFALETSATVTAIAMRDGQIEGLLDPAVYEITGITSLQKISEDDGLRVYPNPSADGIFHVGLEAGSGGTVRFEVLGVDGRILDQGRFEGLSHRFNLTGLPAGSYHLRLMLGNKILTRHLLRN